MPGNHDTRAATKAAAAARLAEDRRAPSITRLQDARVRAGISQRTLAKQARIAVAVIRKLEADPDAGWTRTTITALAKALSVDTSWLAFGHVCGEDE